MTELTREMKVDLMTAVADLGMLSIKLGQLAKVNGDGLCACISSIQAAICRIIDINQNDVTKAMMKAKMMDEQCVAMIEELDEVTEGIDSEVVGQA